jgi:alpha-mannosidase
MKRIQVIEDGEIYLGIEAFFEKENSKARIEYRIYKNCDDVDVNVTLFFNDANKMVKLAVPVPNSGSVIGQTAFGTEDDRIDSTIRVSLSYTNTREDIDALIEGLRAGITDLQKK